MSMKCPICKGKGEIKEIPNQSRKDEVLARREMIRTLYKSGYSYRQIKKFLNIGSTRTVGLALK